MRKAFWVLIGIVAPELVVYISLMQHISAEKLTKVVNSHLEKDVSCPTITIPLEFTRKAYRSIRASRNANMNGP